ncbi:MAG: hypothetical protein PHW36_00745 [Bacilli bacterium]|nr:hypothetical protein [Bacilli bacterium]
MQLGMCRSCSGKFLDESEPKEIPDLCIQSNTPIRDIKRCPLARNGKGAEDWQVPEDWDYEKLRDWFIQEGFPYEPVSYSKSDMNSFYVLIGKTRLYISKFGEKITIESPRFKNAPPYVEFYILFSRIGCMRHLKYPTDEIDIYGKDRGIIACILHKDADKVQNELMQYLKEQSQNTEEA